MTKTWFVVLSVFLVLSASCSCSVGLKSADRKRVDELNENLKEIVGLKTEIHTLNENLEELKALNPTLEGLTGVMTRVAEVLESINSKLDNIPKRFLSP